MAFSLRLGGRGDADGHSADERVERSGDDLWRGGDAAEDFHTVAEIAAELDFAQLDEALRVHHPTCRPCARKSKALAGRVSAGAAVMLAKRTCA
jgi:hypothetical protein